MPKDLTMPAGLLKMIPTMLRPILLPVSFKEELGNLDRLKRLSAFFTNDGIPFGGSYLQIAGIKMQKQDFQNAIVYAKRALDYNGLNIPALELLVSAYSKNDNPKEEPVRLASLLEIDPLNHYARFEKYLLDQEGSDLQNFKSLIRNELPYETYLELALEYVNQGLDSEAILVLGTIPSLSHCLLLAGIPVPEFAARQELNIP